MDQPDTPKEWARTKLDDLIDRLIALLRRRHVLPPEPWNTTMPPWPDAEE